MCFDVSVFSRQLAPDRPPSSSAISRSAPFFLFLAFQFFRGCSCSNCFSSCSIIIFSCCLVNLGNRNAIGTYLVVGTKMPFICDVAPEGLENYASLGTLAGTDREFFRIHEPH
jgi:hypothetical protein